MAFTTIESSELVDKGVSGLSDTPDIEASDLKERFDSLGKLAIQKFQTHINELEANTASGSIGANVPAGLNASANVQSLIDALYLIIKDLKEYKHNHSNRDVLELITADVKESYDRLATIFNTISEVENVVTDNASKIPTSAAIVKLTQDIYANKNVEALQAVEAAQAAQAETESVAADLREYAEVVQNALSNVGRTADDALRNATATAEHAQTVLTTAETSANSAKTYAEQAQEAWERISNSGSTGVPSADGKSAYELAVDNGFSGTLAEWLLSLKGDKGDSGVEQQITVSNAVTSYSIKPNILYVFPEESALTISFDETGIDTSVVNDYHFTFVNGSTACELELPESVNIGDLELQPNTVCEISIVNGLLSFQNWSTE